MVESRGEEDRPLPSPAGRRSHRVEQVGLAGSVAAVLIRMVERTISAHYQHDEGPGDERIARTLARVIWLVVYGVPPSPPARP